MIDELIERARGLTGPDREVDALIAAHFHVKQITGTWPDWCIDPPFTASLDAAVALGEKVLPDRTWYLMTAALKLWSIADGKVGDLARFYVLAILSELALLSAIKAKEARDDR